MHALYAFMRHSDDLADEPQSVSLPGCPDGNPRDALARWRRFA